MSYLYLNEDSTFKPPITEDSIIILVLDMNEKGVQTSYGYRTDSSKNVRIDAVYSWMRSAIEDNSERDIDFLEIMVSVVLKLRDHGLIEL